MAKDMINDFLKAIKNERTKKLNLKEEMFVDFIETQIKYGVLKYKYKSPIEEKSNKKKTLKKNKVSVGDVKPKDAAKTPKITIESKSNTVETKPIIKEVEVAVKPIVKEIEVSSNSPADSLLQELMGSSEVKTKEDINYDDIFLDIN